MSNPLGDVCAFHNKFGFPVDQNLCDSEEEGFPKGFGTGLLYMAKGLIPLAIEMGNKGDERMRRVQLMLEELAEVIEALDHRDPVELADALSDLQYVVLGTAASFGIPLPQCHDEVHRSNMSKTRDPEDPRMKAKDPTRGYFPPDLESVLSKYMACGLRYPSATFRKKG